MSNEMQEYMLSHCQAIKTAQEALEGYTWYLDNKYAINFPARRFKVNGDSHVY